MTGRRASSIYCSKPCKHRAAYALAAPERRAAIRADRVERYTRTRADRLAVVAAWQANHRVTRRATENARRARRLGHPDSVGVSLADWTRLVRRHDGRCAYCQTAPAEQMEHVIPLIRGGRDAIGNVLPVCGSCNARKGRRLLTEWRRDQAQQSAALPSA